MSENWEKLYFLLHKAQDDVIISSLVLINSPQTKDVLFIITEEKLETEILDISSK